MRKEVRIILAGLFLLIFTSQIPNVDAGPTLITGTPSTCIAPDNGTGTVTLPAPCPYITLDSDPMVIVDGLPPTAGIELDASLETFTCTHPGGLCTLPFPPGTCELAGGSLGGNAHCFEANLDLEVTGTGSLTGFNRHIVVPVELEVHTGPRNPGDQVQSFPADLFRLHGELFGDPDFCAFRIVAGTDFGLPSPGQITLTRQPSGDFAVESFFDVTYQIEFTGCPSSILAGYGGTTTATIRWLQGDQPEPWEPGDGHKMHFPQLPDEEGWDVNATYPVILGEDWTCSESGWIKDIHFWGSWLNGTKGAIQSFLISIREDVPSGVDLPYSHPGEILWEKEITGYYEYQFNPATQEGWFDPATGTTLPNNHTEYFQYDIDLDSLDWFYQNDGTVYWLCVSANIANISGTQWGWKSSLDNWLDYATWATRGDQCIEPDNGTGTITLPADCPIYTIAVDPMEIINGLPPGTTIEMDANLNTFTCTHSGGMCTMPLPPNVCETAGGTLGGNGHCFEGSLDLEVRGTGALAGFNRHLSVPVELEVHTGPRNPGDPVQTFQADIYRMYGELFGDPDFCLFRLIGGTDFGLPSPGQITLTELPSGDFAVESFFDVTYQIEFEGCPGSILTGYLGTTTATVRWFQGEDETSTWQELATVDAECIEPDNGAGTVTLPADCQYTTDPVDPMLIVDGLPIGATIEMDAVLDNYLCTHSGGYCSLPLPPGQCEGTGGSLGGNGHCFEAYLYLDVEGTGPLAGFNRNLAVPVVLEAHTGPRNPGDPVQTFSADLYRLQGELFGDPDFCTFRVIGGTDYGLPSPGQMTLTRLPDGDFAVESFFDITYQIEFEGCPSSVLEDYKGTTTATVRWYQGGAPTIEELNLSFVITAGDDCFCGDPVGDVNCDAAVNPVDVVYMVNYVYKNQDARCYPTGWDCPYDIGDVDCNGGVNPVDVVYYVNYVYKNQNAFCDPCTD